MTFCVLALDFDGTITENGKPHLAVTQTIQETRARGIVVVLVTGRILSDLKRVAGDLKVFDAVVAENGAVLASSNGRTRALGRPPPSSLLFRQGVRHRSLLLTRMDAPTRKLQPFNVGGRMTQHVRHRSKYLEVPMMEHHASVFTCNGNPIGSSARTLKEFVAMMARLPVASIEWHTSNSDFSSWIAEVFGD